MNNSKAERVVLIFIDGLGVGSDDIEINPIARARADYLGIYDNGSEPDLPLGGVSKPLDAGLGIEGIPQSATGQTALLTGVNAARDLGRHLFGFPNKRLQEIILESSLLKRARAAGLKPAFLNVFRPPFFELGEAVWEKATLSVTTWVNRAAGLPFFTLDDLTSRRAIYQEFTNQALRDNGYDVPLFTSKEAGAILARRSPDYDLLLYEYFRTDEVGHSRDMDRGAAEIRRLEEFLESFLAQVDLDRTLVVVTSDHGNIENVRTRGHTCNPALTALWGCGAADVAAGLESILDVTGALLEVLTSA